MNELGELLRIGFVKGVEIGDLMPERLDQAIVDLLALVGTKGPLQHLLGIVQTTFDQELTPGDEFYKIFEYTLSLLRSDRGNTGDFAAYGLNFLLRETLDEIGTCFLPKNDEQNRGPSNSRSTF